MKAAPAGNPHPPASTAVCKPYVVTRMALPAGLRHEPTAPEAVTASDA